MKKKYTPPDMELVVLETKESIMAWHSENEPDWDEIARSVGPSAESYVQSLPKGYVDTDDE